MLRRDVGERRPLRRALFHFVLDVARLVLLVALVGGCSRGCARRMIEEKLAPVLPSAVPMGPACEEGLLRCFDGRLERSRAPAGACESPEGCPCLWDALEECPAPKRCAVDGLEIDMTVAPRVLCETEGAVAGHEWTDAPGDAGRGCEDGYLCCRGTDGKGTVLRGSRTVFLCDRGCRAEDVGLPGDLSDGLAGRMLCAGAGR